MTPGDLGPQVVGGLRELESAHVFLVEVDEREIVERDDVLRLPLDHGLVLRDREVGTAPSGVFAGKVLAGYCVLRVALIHCSTRSSAFCVSPALACAW